MLNTIIGHVQNLLIFLIHKYLQPFVSLRASLVVNIVDKLSHYGRKFKDLRMKYIRIFAFEL